MSEYLQAYLDESDEELETLVQSLLTLEENPREVHAMNEAFRMLHSLKGSSGMMGFEGIAGLAHHLETRFDQFRSGGAVLNRATMDVMLKCVDFFKTFITQLRDGNTIDQNGAILIKQLESLQQTQPNDPGQSPQPGEAKPAGLISMGGGYRVRITFRKGLQLADLKAKLIIARLSNIGDIVASDPPVDSIESIDDLPQFVVVVATDEPPAEVIAIANVDGVESVEIDSQGDNAEADVAVSPEVTASPVADTEQTIEWNRDAAPSSAVKPREQVDTPKQPVTVSSGEGHDQKCSTEISNTVTPIASPMAENVEIPPPSIGNEASRQRVAETVRVDIDRLDRLMNLTGELVVTNARFNQITNQISPALRRSRGVGRMSDLTEKLREGLREIRRIGDEQSELNGWSRILDELDDDIESLQEDSELWDEGRRHFSQIAEAVDQLTRVSDSLQRGVLDTRMVPVGPLFSRFKRVIRDLSNERQKNVELVIRGEKTELDKRMIDELGDPLLHLIRNSIDHGLESAEVRRQSGKPDNGVIVLDASHSGNNVFVTVRDDGAGIDVEKVRTRLVERELATHDMASAMSDEQVVNHIWHPGFSTAEHVTDISGRGVGMDIVKSRIAELNGSIDVSTSAGKGTTFSLRLPLTLAIIRSLMVRFRESFFTIPIDDVQEIVSVPAGRIYTVHGHRTIDVRGEYVPLTTMDRVFEWHDIDYTYDAASSPDPGQSISAKSDAYVVILHSRGKTLGLCVDELLGGADIVIKSFTDNFVSIRGLSGASIMGDGAVCLMLDTDAVIEMV